MQVSRLYNATEAICSPMRRPRGAAAFWEHARGTGYALSRERLDVFWMATAADGLAWRVWLGNGALAPWP